MKKVFINPLTILFMVALTSLGCSSKFSGFDKTESGLYYKIYKVSEDTMKAKTGDFISLDMRYANEKDSVLFDTRANKGQQIRFQLPPSDFQGDLYEGIRMMSPGDSAVFLINSDSLFTKTFRMPKRPDFIDSNSVLKFYVTLHSAESVESLQAKEKELLKVYLESNQILAEPLGSGLYYVETVSGAGKKIDTGAVVKMHFILSLSNGAQVFSSYDRGEPLQMTFGKPFDTPGFDQGIGMMKKGGKAKLIVPSEIAFGSAGRGSVIPPYSMLIYDVEVFDVLSKAENDKQQAEKKKQDELKKTTVQKEESGKLQKYLVENKITVKPTPSGLYFIEQQKGTGAKAEPGKRVKVHYTGRLLDGTKFDSSVDRGEPFGFTLGKGQVIKGWDEGVALMNVGGKATLIIPSSIAYGDRDMGTIPPFSTLVFDVELIEVE
ncbi:MAG: FKBP-type peptidyl-prolyl cis-trans isomerase [bacterium]